MAEDRDELVRHYRQMRAELLETLDGLDDALMEEASLDGWSIRDHLAHLALWDGIRADEVVRISAGHGSAWRMTEEQDETFNALMHEARGGLSLAQVKWELARSHRQLVEAIEAATARGLEASHYGEAGLRSLHEAQHAGWIRRWRGERGV